MEKSAPAAKILIVDDVPSILKATTRIMQSAGYDTITAENGEIALQLLYAEKPNLVLLDANMPGMDGFEVCRRIKADPLLSGTFVFIFSGTLTDSASQSDGLDSGADGYLTRPLPNRELIARVQSILRIQAVERALQNSVAEWQTTFDAVGDAILLTDSDFNVLKCNRMTTEFFELSIEDILGKKCYQVVHGEAQPIPECPLTRVSQHKHRESLQFFHNQRWLEISVDPILAEDGTFTGTVHVIKDITERKRIEEQLQASESKFRTLFENMVAASCVDEIVYQDGRAIDYRILEINPAFERITGLAREQVVDRLASQVYGSGQAPFLDIYSRVAETGEPLRFEAYFAPLAKHLEIMASSPKPGMFSTVFSDISERKMAEMALRESEDRYRDLFENSQDLICTHDLHGRILSVNPFAEKTIGIRAAELLQMNIRDILAPEVRSQVDAYLEVIKAHGAANGLLVIQTSSGEKRVWEYHNTLRTEGVTEPVVRGIARDITERRRAEKKLRESDERLRLALAATDQGLYDLNVQTGDAIVNEAYARILEYDPADFHETNAAWIERLHPEDHEPVVQIFRDYIAGKIPEYRVEFRQRTRTGKWVWISSLGKVIQHDEQGNPLRMLGTHTNITERKQVEERLHQQLEELRRWHNATLGREMRILELKKEVNELLLQTGLPPRYTSAEELQNE